MKATWMALLAATALAACAPVATKVESGDRTIERMVVSLDGAWNEITVPEGNTAMRNALDIGPAHVWTMEGLPVDRLLIYAGLKDGQPVHGEGAANAKRFEFRSTKGRCLAPMPIDPDQRAVWPGDMPIRQDIGSPSELTRGELLGTLTRNNHDVSVEPSLLIVERLRHQLAVSHEQEIASPRVGRRRVAYDPRKGEQRCRVLSLRTGIEASDVQVLRLTADDGLVHEESPVGEKRRIAMPNLLVSAIRTRQQNWRAP